MSGHPINTLKARRFYVCIFREGNLIRIGDRAGFGWAYKLKQKHAGSFMVTEYMVVDPEAYDIGTIFWYDEKGVDMENHAEVFLRFKS